MAAKYALLTCLASTLYMTGLATFVQVVHYPLFGRVDASAFPRYHAEHVRRTGLVVGLPMVAELASSLVLVFRRPEGVGAGLAWTGLGAAGVTWISTAWLSVPAHDRLSRGFDAAIHRRLVVTNGVRLAAWGIHSSVLLAMIGASLR